MLFIIQLTFLRYYFFPRNKANLRSCREAYAASRIQGVIRGYLVRQRFMFLVIHLRACLKIQKVMRGKLGRLRWWRHYYLKSAVVKSEAALKVLILVILLRCILMYVYSYY